jgi:hypothetical protein
MSLNARWRSRDAKWYKKYRNKSEHSHKRDAKRQADKESSRTLNLFDSFLGCRSYGEHFRQLEKWASRQSNAVLARRARAEQLQEAA